MCPILSSVNSDFSLKLSALLPANAESWYLDNPLPNACTHTHTYTYTHTIYSIHMNTSLTTLLTYSPYIKSN